MTLASACLRHICINYLKSNQIGIIPDNGYHRDSNQSTIALKFIKWLEHKTGLHIQHQECAEGEHRVFASNGSVLRLDGYIKGNNGGNDIAIEFLGCAWHGHECLYRQHELCLNGKTALYNKDKLEERINLLKEEGICTYTFWECEANKALEDDPRMALFFAQLSDSGPLFPRDSFHGGRTGPLSLKCNLEDIDEYEISCFDVVSLYPAVNFYAFYPIGHPEVLDINLEVNWTMPEDLRPYRGIFKVFIIPPEDLYLPVIPERINGKLQKKYLAKTCNNSMWGRWALRCNLTKDCITSSPAKLHTVLNDPKLEIGAIEMLTPDLYAVPYKSRREFVRPHDKYNIVLALITTATARVMLYEYMNNIVNEKDCKLLYTDTDSCFYLHKIDKKPPFRVGDMLGMMSREYEDWLIMSFYTGGCKQYAMKMKHRESGEIKYIVKCRGCWDQVDTPLDYNHFRRMVEAYGEKQDPVILERTHFQPSWRKGQVISQSQIRRYTPIYDKGIVDANFDCYPYGYRGNPINDPTK
uniref:DNA-directed DNA polymerase n=1 Tax=Meloidogyne incognita TaxID=6306 RepID=A0A914M031_MELIC